MIFKKNYWIIGAFAIEQFFRRISENTFEMLERSFRSYLQNSPALFSIDIDRQRSKNFQKFIFLHAGNIVFADYRFSSKAFESISRQRRGRRNRESESYSSTIALLCLRYWKVTLKKFYLRTRSPYTLISRLLLPATFLQNFFPLDIDFLFEAKFPLPPLRARNRFIHLRRTCDNFLKKIHIREPTRKNKEWEDSKGKGIPSRDDGNRAHNFSGRGRGERTSTG